MRKVLLTTVFSTLILSSISYANTTVSCPTFLKATKYARVISQTSKECFFVRRHFHKNISNEKYFLLNGKIMISQSRVLKDQKNCGAYSKNIVGKFEKYDNYHISKTSFGYSVKVIYDYGAKGSFLVYPLTQQQFKAALKHLKSAC